MSDDRIEKLKALVANADLDPEEREGLEAIIRQAAPSALIDTANDALWGIRGGQLTAMRPGAFTRVEPNRALVMAAWMVALSEAYADFTFADALQAVKDSWPGAAL